MQTDPVRGPDGPKPTLGQTIRGFRESAGMAPSELAGRSRLNERCVLEIESDQYEPSDDALGNFVTALQHVGASYQSLQELLPSRRLVQQEEEDHRRARPTRYVKAGMSIGMVIGVIGGSLFAMSDLNPNKGGFLDLRTSLILLSCPLVGSLIGYLVGRVGK